MNQQLDTSSGINIDLSSFAVLGVLADLPGVFIKQKFLITEALTGLQRPQVYNVFPGSEKGQQRGDKPIFQCRERSECCQRICLPTDCRSFEIKVKQDDNHDHTVMEFDRDCRCSCLCLNRPEMIIKLTTKTRTEKIGKLVCPWTCCNKAVDIYDEQDKFKYKLIANCCQLANWCACPCQACQTIRFDTFDVHGQRVAELWKKSAGCIKQCCDSTDNFQVEFPKDANPQEKTLLMASAIFLDYMYFEINKDQLDNHPVKNQ